MTKITKRYRVSIERIEQHTLNQPKNPRGPRARVCDVCQLRKVKCSREQPSCKNCIRLGYPCSYNRINSKPKLSLKECGSNQTVRAILPLDDRNPPIYSSTALVPIKTKIKKVKGIDLDIMKKTMMGLMNRAASVPDLKFIKIMLKFSTLNDRKSQVGVDEDGMLFYIGSSMGASYFASHSQMLTNAKDLNSAVVAPTSLLNNLIRCIQVDFKARQKEVIDLYFSYLNTFFPIIYPPSFFSKLNHIDLNDHGFLALLNVVCLCGTSFYPDRSLANILDEYFSHKATYHLKQCYLKPSLATVQACAILAFHINSTESDNIVGNAWYFSGIAHQMAIQLGFHLKCPKRSKTTNDLIARVLWLMSINEVLISHITGRLSWLGAEKLMSLPTTDTSFVSINLENSSLVEVPELLCLTGEASLKFFRHMCMLIVLTSRLDTVNKLYQKKGADGSAMPTSNFFKTALNQEGHPKAVKKDNRLRVLNELERKAIIWYNNLPSFLSSPRPPQFIIVSEPNDLHLGALSVYFFSFLIDLNKFKIRKSDYLQGSIPGRSHLLTHSLAVNITDTEALNPLEKCFLVARLAHETSQRSKGKLAKVCTPLYWHATLQIIFIFLMTLDRCENHPWAKELCQGYLLQAQKTLQEGATRWVLVKDCLIVVQPFLQKYLSL